MFRNEHIAITTNVLQMWRRVSKHHEEYSSLPPPTHLVYFITILSMRNNSRLFPWSDLSSVDRLLYFMFSVSWVFFSTLSQQCWFKYSNTLLLFLLIAYSHSVHLISFFTSWLIEIYSTQEEIYSLCRVPTQLNVWKINFPEFDNCTVR